ncbi:MAG: class IV adenylate cyclase [Candidatus Zhuqueibacterota bacterium]
MSHLNIEIKARCRRPATIRTMLQQHRAEFKGIDHQIDTYFYCSHGRLKLREGTIEHHLVHYERDDAPGPKKSLVTLYQPNPDSDLKQVLAQALGVLIVVDKMREIYFIDYVKFHIDEVKELGSFVEIEAIDSDGTIGQEALRKQCEKYIDLFSLTDKDFISLSYSDLLLRRQP